MNSAAFQNRIENLIFDERAYLEQKIANENYCRIVF